MLLSFDEQLFQQTNGQTGEKLERALEEEYVNENQPAIWGAELPSTHFLLEHKRAENFCFQLVKDYWGKVNSIFYDSFHEANFNVDIINEKMEQFFAQRQNKQLLFSFLHAQGEVEFDQLIEFILAKPVRTLDTPTGLDKLYVYKVNERFIIQPIYSEQAAYWKTIGAKKIYSLFLQLPLAKFERPNELMLALKALLLDLLTVNRVATIVHKLVQKIDYENPKSDELKQLHILNISTHFTSGRRHMLKLRKCIATLQQNWLAGPFALNNKEQTLLGYMLFQEAVYKKDWLHILEQGMYLIEEERLNDHAIELVLEYADVLNSMNPQPYALVKDYQQNYLEHVFYELVDSIVKEEQFVRGMELLKNYELATCTTIFELLHASSPEETLHTIEATVQRDIAVLVDQSTQNIRESLATWQLHYLDKKSAYYPIADMTSQHICNLLKILFYAEQDLIVEKLLSVYKKYLLIPAHFHHLRQFVEGRVHSTS